MISNWTLYFRVSCASPPHPTARPHNSAKAPPPAINSPGSPCSTTFPSPITTTQSACLKVLSRCASTKLVLPAISKRIAFCVLASVSGSIALVASSRIRIRGSAIIALAKQINCLCPSDRAEPRSPTSASRPSGMDSIVSRQSSLARAARTSSRVAPGFTMRMFS